MQISEYKFKRIIKNPRTKMYVSLVPNNGLFTFGLRAQEQVYYLLDGYWYVEYYGLPKGQKHFRVYKNPSINLYEVIKRG